MSKINKLPIITMLTIGISLSSLMVSYANSNTQTTTATQSARWVGSGEEWRVSDNQGGYLKNSWFQDDITGHWYLLGAEDGSVMFSGLITDSSTGKTYLLNTEHDGTYGRMLTENGNHVVNGKTVYLEFQQAHDGTYGSITSGLAEARGTGATEKELQSISVGESDTQQSTGNTSNVSSGSHGNYEPRRDYTVDEANKLLEEMLDLYGYLPSPGWSENPVEWN